MDTFLIAAIVLMVLGVLGSAAPMVSGGVLSLLGFYLYWWHTGFAQPGVLFAGFFTLTGLIVILTDYFGGAIGAKAGGASSVTVGIAVLAGIFLFFATGPIGFLLGIMATVFLVELYHGNDMEDSLKAAGFAAIGVLGSAVVQFLLTLTMLISFLLVVML